MADTPIEAIKARLDAVEIIGQSVQLRKAGRTFKGLCPFHGEKTPSFVVWPEEGGWKCFGCGESGDVFSFVMKRDHLEFGEALRLLADKAGIELPERPSRAAQHEEEHARLFGALQSAALFYHGLLGSGSGGEARQYLERRGLTTETIDAYLLGYAPPSSGVLQRHLLEAGYTVEEGERAGLLGNGERGTYDWFRGRILFPIRDVKGRVVGFGARAMSDDQQPKYLNTPQTPLFDKGAILYGLDRARAAIRSEQRAVVVEGYMDVLAVHQRGFLNVVATLGTAITERHLDQLKRLTPEVVLALDADSAGQMATERGIEVARGMDPDDVVPEIEVGRSKSGGLKTLIRYRSTRKTQVRVAVLPAGMDPDDLVKSDPLRWKHLVDHALAVVDFALARLGGRHDLKSAEGKSAAAAEALAFIHEIADPVERAHYLQRLAQMVDVEERVLAERVGRVTVGPKSKAAQESAPTGDVLDEYTLALATKLGAAALQRVEADQLDAAESKALLRALGGVELSGPESLAELRPQVESWLDGCVGRVASYFEMWDVVAQDTLERWFEISLLRLKLRAASREIRQLHALLATPDEPDAPRWHARLAQLTREILPLQQALARQDRIGLAS